MLTVGTVLAPFSCFFTGKTGHFSQRLPWFAGHGHCPVHGGKTECECFASGTSRKPWKKAIGSFLAGSVLVTPRSHALSSFLPKHVHLWDLPWIYHILGRKPSEVYRIVGDIHPFLLFFYPVLHPVVPFPWAPKCPKMRPWRGLHCNILDAAGAAGRNNDLEDEMD